MLDWLHAQDLMHWVSLLGYTGLLIIVFVETGLFFGFFLPGDSLLFIAGVLASQGIFNIWLLITLLTVTAFVGYTFGYWFGNKLGYWLMKQPDRIWFKKKYIHKAHEFYEHHGGKSLVLGRLVPIVRTFVPIVAGMAGMPFKTYTFYNVIGAIVWGCGVTLFGYYLGGVIPDAGNYLLLIIGGIILLSILPAIWHFVKKRYVSKK